jgi:hypothetical protein
MPECVWCGNNGSGYWECDGEGGEGQCPPFDHPHRPKDCVPGAPHWEIHATRQLCYRNGKPVTDSNGDPVEVHVDAVATPHKVLLNDQDVGHGNGPCGSPPPKGPPPRHWSINTIVTPIHDKDGNVVTDPNGKPTRVRVQSYVYPSPGGPDHCDGDGPKLRFYAINPDDPDCDPQA